MNENSLKVQYRYIKTTRDHVLPEEAKTLPQDIEW
jgi:hypothetical protein